MAELNDYSGEFRPDLKIGDFSKDFLMRMMMQWHFAYTRLDEVWVGNVTPLLGEEQTTKLDIAAWARQAELTLPKIAKAANIEVKHVVDALKVFQVMPDNTSMGLYPSEYEIINPDHVKLSVKRCLTLEWMKKNAPERVVQVCHNLEPTIVQKYISVLLPDAKIKALKLPPHKSPDESPVCIWEYWRE